ncbi:MAG: PocR ligand-binding domain-containing protein [Nitrospinae bacterium]|nr:PocR ligand-binding domain-containing protein [Nitrospinota bacterium]
MKTAVISHAFRHEGFEAGARTCVRRELSDYVDINRLSRMLNDFCQVTGLMVDVIDRRSGDILVAEGIKSICVHHHKECPMSDLTCKEVSGLSNEGGLAGVMISRCDIDLSTAVSPIFLDGEYLGDIFLGPVLLAPMENEKIAKLAQTFGFDKKQYQRMYGEVNVIRVDELAEALACFREMILAIVTGGGDEKSYASAYHILFKAARYFIKET